LTQMDHKISENLRKLGLQDNEAKIYLALLELGRGTVSTISNAAQLNRTTGYDVLERLALYGLASRAGSGTKKKYYSAEPPVRLKQYLENKKTQAEKRLEDVNDVLRDLQGLYRKESKPVIKFFEGRDGIKNIYWHTLESKSVIYSILDLSVYLPSYDQFGKEYIRERAKRNVREKCLVLKNKAGLDYYNAVYKNNKSFQKITEYRWLSKEFPFVPAAEVNIYDDIVMGVLVKPGENAAFEIQNPSFANSLKIIFELAWEQGEKIK
jgi:HTH-type transcriptional regulator, sugar sensing transcriptional regulator